MDEQARNELEGHTTRLESYDVEKAEMEKLRLKLASLFAQTHETVSVAGVRRRVKLTKRRKIAKANQMIDKAFESLPDISQDAINQLVIFTDE